MNADPESNTDRLIDDHRRANDLLWAFAENLAAKVCTCNIPREELMMPATHNHDCPVVEASLAAFEDVAKK